jgi:CRP-like cAMP-binding protein
MQDVKKSRIFQGLNETQVANLVAAAEPLTFATGDVLVDPERPAERLLVLTRGEASVSVGGRELATVSAPCVVGEMEFLNRTFRPAKVLAKGTMETLSFGFDQLASREADGDVATLKLLANVARVLAARLVAMNEKFTEIAGQLDANDPRTSDLEAFQRQLFSDWDV